MEVKNKRADFYKKATLLLVALFAVAALAVVGVLVYYRNSIEINQGNIGYCLQGDELSITWLAEADRSMYRLSRYDENSGEYVLCGEYAGGGARLTGVEPEREMTLRMQGVRTVNVLGHNVEILGKPRILTVLPVELACPVLTKTVDQEAKNVKITWDTEPDNSYQIYLMSEEGDLELYSETEDSGITFSAENTAALAGREQVLGIAVRAVRRTEEYTLYGPVSEMAVAKRADLMEDELNLVCEENGAGGYTFSWQEGKGDWYELQEWSLSGKEWISRQVYQWSDVLSYETGRLPSCTKVRFRVITYNDEGLRDREIFAAEPSEVTFRTERSPVYCTVWPLTALPVSEDASGKNVMGQVAAGKALCVLEEKEGRFLVRCNDEYGYIDSNYCLIDLAEYLGDLCKYNITNSYSSVFRAHEYEIPEITDTVIKGYEKIHMANGDTLVPYLYPCAQKLYQAALLAEADGYFLHIYDAYRPNEATRYLYDTFELLLDKPVPELEEETEDGAEQKVEEPVDEQQEKVRQLSEQLDPATTEALKGFSKEALTALYILPQEYLENIASITPEMSELSGESTITPEMSEQPDGSVMTPEMSEQPDGSAAASQLPEDEYTAVISALTPEDIALLQSLQTADIPVLKELTSEELEALQVYLANILTYRKVVTDYRFAPNYFLSRTISTHNRGIALDLTLGSAATEEDLAMQTDIHDLSWYSMLEKNNENADRLASYMKSVGYRGLISEWWHFQDDETRYALNLGYLEKGVSPEGWKKDDLGWKYRLADGTYYYACTVMIEEKERTFNEEGYLIEQ